MYHNKKIGIFISHIMGFYQKNVCQGIIDKALEYGYTAEIFASMDGENLGDYSLGEESILTLPNFDDLSGVIFASETYPNEQLKDQIYSLLKEKCHCPIIEIAVYKQQFPSVSLENNILFLILQNISSQNITTKISVILDVPMRVSFRMPEKSFTGTH